MNVLVTGGLGYLGSEIVPALLRRGDGVVIVDDFSRCAAVRPLQLTTSGLKVIKGDCTGGWLMHITDSYKIDAILLLAAVVGAPACEQEPDKAMAVNQIAVEKLAQALGQDRIVVYPNTTAGYVPKHDKADESCEMVGHTVYARTKIAAERVLLDKCGAVSLRLASVYGRSAAGVIRDDTFVNALAKQAVAGNVIKVVNPSHMRDIVHVRDVGRAFLHAIDCFPWLRGHAYNVGERNLTKRLAARCVADQASRIYAQIEEVDDADPDKRDFAVDHTLWRSKGFHYEMSFSAGLKDLLGALQGVLT